MGVIGQTGRTVLSDDVIQFKASHKKTVRYRTQLMSSVKVATDNKRERTVCLWKAEVIGPFHSVLYGVCSYGSTKKRAKAALQHRLAADYRYIGIMLLSAVDDADNVGNVDLRLWDQVSSGRPIVKGHAELVGSAGM
jgi:hypothetical protein